MSIAQGESIKIIANAFLKIVLGLCAGLLTLLYANLLYDVRETKSEVKELGKEQNLIQVDVAKIKGHLKIQ